MFNFVMKQAMKSQMKNVPKDQQEKIMELIKIMLFQIVVVELLEMELILMEQMIL